MNLITHYNYCFSELILQKIKIFLLLALFTISSSNVFAQNTSLISNCDDFVTGPNTNWPFVIVATTIDSGTVSQAAQTYTINITSLPVNGANFRVYKTVANGNDFFGNPIALIIGSNSITVPAVTFDRAVKFQFSSGDVEFDVLTLNGEDSDCVVPLPPSSTSLISNCEDFVIGSNTNWPYVLVATTIDSGIFSQVAQTYTINITSLPVSGANVRVYKTVANGNDFFGNPISLMLGLNSITVPAVSFDRAVKFQFSSGDVEFDALSLNEVDSECVSNLTAIEVPENEVFLNIFPNPSNGDIFIKSNNPIKSLKIKDLSGRVVLEIAPQQSKVQIQTLQLNNSFYFISCLINQEWITQKIIIN